MKTIIIGGGAASFFFAVNAVEQNPGMELIILEMGKSVLGKVLVSGGGRCNVTNACTDPSDLIHNYPRGAKELLGPFYHFGPAQLVDWFESRGVPLKTEADGRMFPQSNQSSSIANCLQDLARKHKVQVLTSQKVNEIQIPDEQSSQFKIKTLQGKNFKADQLFIGAGSSQGLWKILNKLGHRIVEPVPSLFTFKIKDPRIEGLAGIAVPQAIARVVDLPGKKQLEAEGPLLITHWGFSGPAILKMSAWGARELKELKYDFTLEIDWLPQVEEDEIRDWKKNNARSNITNHRISGLPKRLWARQLEALRIPVKKNWGDLNKEEIGGIVNFIKKSHWKVRGKNTFKEEFVTAGGVHLKEVDFTKFESKIIPNLFMAGEILNIDAITGGFNFQAAWTGAYIAASSLHRKNQ